MTTPTKTQQINQTNGFFFGAFRQYATCFAGILCMSLIEASSRTIQLGLFGKPGSILNVLLEILVWAARAGIILVILGAGNPFKWQKGTNVLKNLAKQPFNLDGKWLVIVLKTGLFAVAMAALNWLLASGAEAIARQNYTPFLDKPEPILFFFKNMTTIPFTIVFAYQVYIFVQQPADKK